MRTSTDRPARPASTLRPVDELRIATYVRERSPRSVTITQVKGYVWTNNAPFAAVRAYLESLVDAGLATATDEPRMWGGGPERTRHYTATARLLELPAPARPAGP